MRYYHHQDQEIRLIVENDSGRYDLTAAKPQLGTFRDLARTADLTNQTIDEVATQHIDTAVKLGQQDVDMDLADPVVADEIWAAGVTYKISEEARESESSMPEMYLDVYDADRPEIFFKATPNRTTGPEEAVGIRADSTWDVPEPELGVVLYDGEPVGYTVGNDMSSRSIEGENALYLPQAKVYDRCCAIGPCVATDIADPHALSLAMTIYRNDEPIYSEQTSTGRMDRDCSELVSYLTAHNVVPELAVLLTGTSLVPDDDFSLREGDRVEIEIEDVGILRNQVTVV